MPLNKEEIRQFPIIWAEPYKVDRSISLVGRQEELRQCMAAWGLDPDKRQEIPGVNPLHFRIEGPPGVGKNEIVLEIARRLNEDLYIIQGHEEMTPEDLGLLLVPSVRKLETATGKDADVSMGSGLVFRASPLATAIRFGGLVFFDEINRVQERSLAPLASVLDNRKSFYSGIAGLHIVPAAGAKSFRFCCAMNPGSTTSASGRLPEFIDERTLPVIEVDYQEWPVLFEIVQKRLMPDSNLEKALIAWFEANQHQVIAEREIIALVSFAQNYLRTNPNLSPPDALEFSAKRTLRHARPARSKKPVASASMQTPPANSAPDGEGAAGTNTKSTRRKAGPSKTP